MTPECITSLNVTEFKRLRKGLVTLMSYGVPYEMALKLVFGRIVSARQHRDRLKFERRTA